MSTNTPTIYVDHLLETVMSSIYGSVGHPCRAGYTSLSGWKKPLVQVFRTIGWAVDKNVNGDDKHRDRMISRCSVAVDSIKHSKSLDEASTIAIAFAIEVIFLLLGHFPRNWHRLRAYHGDVTNLARYRIFSYVRTKRHMAAEALQLRLQPKRGVGADRRRSEPLHAGARGGRRSPTARPGGG